MTNNRILTIAVVLLLLTNIALIVFMLSDKRHDSNRRPYRGKDPSEVMIKELKMSEEQQSQYKQMREEHFKNLKPLFDSIRAARTALFGMIKNPELSDSLVIVYRHRISDGMARVDEMTFNHFRKLRTIFASEQQPKFDSLVQKMMQRGRRDSPGNREK